VRHLLQRLAGKAGAKLDDERGLVVKVSTDHQT
jgi:hypothetical protein